MDDLVVEGRAEGLAGLFGAEAADVAGVGGGVVGQPAGELLPGRVADADDVAFLEFADDLDDADGEQALRARFEGLRARRRRRRNGRAAGRSGRSSACGRGASRRARGRACRPARRRGCGSAARACVPEAMITEPPACVTSRAAASLLCMPPVPSVLRLAPARPRTSSSICGTSGTSSRRRRCARVGPVEAVDHAQDDQQRRLEQVGDHRGEPVVVAELDLVDADRVVLVDDRHGVAFEQGVQRVPHVEVARPAVEVFVRQQELGGVPAVAAQALVVGADQVGLADGRGRLELAEVVGPALPAELADPRARPPPS